VLSKRIVEHKQVLLLWLKPCQISLLGIILMEICFLIGNWVAGTRSGFLKISHDILPFCYFLLIMCTGNLTTVNSLYQLCQILNGCGLLWRSFLQLYIGFLLVRTFQESSVINDSCITNLAIGMLQYIDLSDMQCSWTETFHDLIMPCS
jgi:hypothetical protein